MGSQPPTAPEPPQPYEDSLLMGRRGARTRYWRRPGELIVHFDGPVAAAHGDTDLFLLYTNALDDSQFPRFRRFLGAGKRWIRTEPGRERETARDLAEIDGIRQVTPVYRPWNGGDGTDATPLPSELLVRVRDGWEDDVHAEFAKLKFDHVRSACELLGRDWHLFRRADGETPDDGFEIVRVARRLNGVIEAELDWLKIETYAAGFVGRPDDDYFDDQWALTTIGMEAAWKQNKGEPGSPVVVIDSGFDVGHPDLSFDDGGGLDVQSAWMSAPAHGKSLMPPSDVFHGTAVAGVIGALVNNDIGVASVAGDCKMVPVKIGEEPSAARIAAAIWWAAGRGSDSSDYGPARVVNMSLTTVETSLMLDAIEDAVAADLVLCAAAGNVFGERRRARVGFPARHPEVIGVGASDRHGDRVANDEWESASGCGLDVLAPGVDIYTTDDSPKGTAAPKSGTYDPHFYGTSAACPHVAGLASLLIRQDPSLTRGQVRNIIEWTCVRPGKAPSNPVRPGSAPWSPGIGHGSIYAGWALQYAATLAAKPVPITVSRPEPDVPADVVTVRGWLSKGPGDLWRIHRIDDVGDWLEVHDQDIDWPPCGAPGELIRLRAGAQLRSARLDLASRGS